MTMWWDRMFWCIGLMVSVVTIGCCVLACIIKWTERKGR